MAASDAPSTTRLHRAGSPGERWWFAVLLIPTLLTAVVILTQGETIEADLESETVAALREAGLANTRVDMSGRRVTLLVPTGENVDRAVAVAEEIEGVGDVTGERVAASAAEAKACANLQNKIDGVADGRGIQFGGSGTTVSAAGRVAVKAIADLLVRCPSALVTAEGHVDASVLDGSTVSLRRAEAVKRALQDEGVKSSRIKVQGFGDTFPLAKESSAAAAALNNRVAVTVGD